jgi:hypothetical protein
MQSLVPIMGIEIMASELPEGWSIEGLRHGNYWTIGENAKDATDSRIMTADQIRVKYHSKSTGKDSYRMIHGATGRKQVGDVITKHTAIVSPV